VVLVVVVVESTLNGFEITVVVLVDVDLDGVADVKVVLGVVDDDVDVLVVDDCNVDDGFFVVVDVVDGVVTSACRFCGVTFVVEVLLLVDWVDGPGPRSRGLSVVEVTSCALFVVVEGVPVVLVVRSVELRFSWLGDFVVEVDPFVVLGLVVEVRSSSFSSG